MGKVLHKVFKTVVKDISQDLPPLGESSSEVPPFIPEPIKFSEEIRFSDNMKKYWLKATQKEIQNYSTIRLLLLNIQRRLRM